MSIGFAKSPTICFLCSHCLFSIIFLLCLVSFEAPLCNKITVALSIIFYASFKDPSDKKNDSRQCYNWPLVFFRLLCILIKSETVRNLTVARCNHNFFIVWQFHLLRVTVTISHHIPVSPCEQWLACSPQKKTGQLGRDEAKTTHEY